MPYRSIKTKYKDIVLNEHNDETIAKDGIPKRKYSIVHDNGIYRLNALNVRVRQEQGVDASISGLRDKEARFAYAMETTLVFNNNYKAAKIAEGRYSQAKANQYASNIDQLIITLLGE